MNSAKPQALSTQPYKGTRDFYPDEMRIRRWMFGKMRQVVESYGYEEYDGPLLEPFELYAAKTGEEIVNQQLYWFMDRGERKMAIRPEMTPTLARMVAAHFHELTRPIRWFSFPNLWRYERPQRGRLREHWQLNVDVLGGDSLLADTELLALSFNMIKAFHGEDFVSIRVNNRRLIDHFFSNVLGLTAQVALQTTKALDARGKIGEEAYLARLTEIGFSEPQKQQMEKFFRSSFEEVSREFHDSRGVQELKALFELLKESGMAGKVVFDPTVLRGMDYYTGTVFEMYDISPENNRAMFGGGRYDNLVGMFGNQSLSGVGLGMGDVTLRNFLETHKLLPTTDGWIDVFVSLPKMELRSHAEELAGQLRTLGFKVITPLTSGGFGAQLKLASKYQAKYAILFGDQEMAEGKAIVKDLSKGTQNTYPLLEIPKQLSDLRKQI